MIHSVGPGPFEKRILRVIRIVPTRMCTPHRVLSAHAIQLVRMIGGWIGVEYQRIKVVTSAGIVVLSPIGNL